MPNLASIPSAPRNETLNERLNHALDRVETEADRIERHLSRVNGTPIGPETVSGSAQVSPMRNLVSVVEQFERIAERMKNLAEGVDQVA